VQEFTDFLAKQTPFDALPTSDIELPDPRTIVEDATALQFGHFGTVVTRRRLTASALMADAQSNVTRYMRKIVWCDASDSVRDVARAMTDSEQSCALIRTRDGLGLVTDRDFRDRLGRYPRFC
jgi:CBS domain-containing protein